MKKQTTKMVMPVLALVVLVVLTTALAGPAGDPVSGSGSSSAINAFQFAGSATLVIRGQEKSTLEAPAGLLVTLLEEPRESDDGVLHVVATHTFTFADGSITTSDKEIAEPIDEYGLHALNANMEIVSGTGVYEGITGRLTAHGTINFGLVTPAAEFEIKGFVYTGE